jgi:hypothetical protein
MRALLPIFFCLPLLASDAAKIFYSKSFPNSMPAYAGIDLSRDGTVVYRDSPDDSAPVQFKLPAEDTARIFALADKLDHFKRPLESNLKVAFMGTKTLRYEDGGDKGEAKFNYSLDEDAKAIAEYFERMIESQQNYWDLERAAKFDKLGVNNALLKLEVSVDRNRVIGRERFLPLLDRVAKNESYLHMARERAARLADLFRLGTQTQAQSTSEPGSKSVQ